MLSIHRYLFAILALLGLGALVAAVIHYDLFGDSPARPGGSDVDGHRQGHMKPKKIFTDPKGDERAREVAQRIGPGLRRHLENQGLRYGDPVFMRLFKESKEFEVWLQRPGEKDFDLFRTYKIAKYSGPLGPKLKEGDRRAPEGFYAVAKDQMNPRSRYHLSFNLGFPNTYDRAHGRTGSYLMVHGSNKSIGCYAMTDRYIEEIYTLADAAHKGGQALFQVHCFPFRMTKERMAKAAGHQWESYWLNLKSIYDSFEATKIPPDIAVKDKRYVTRG